MISLRLYTFGAFGSLATLLWDRMRVRSSARLHREDVFASLLGAAAWPLLALAYVGVAGSVWFVRGLPGQPYVLPSVQASSVGSGSDESATPPLAEAGDGYCAMP